MTRARDVANLIGSGNYSSTTFTATAGQTAFTISHTQGFIQVFMNGLLLDETVDYTSNGSAVTLTSGAAAGDEIEVVAYNTFSVGDALNQAAADARYVNTAGDTMTGDLTVDTNTLKVDSSNNRVGMGTASPSQRLHVEGTGNQFILLNNSSTNDGMYLKAGTGASSIQTNGGSHVLNFFTSGTERMKINSSGPVTMPSQPAMSGRAIRPIDTSGYVTTGVNLYVDGGANLEVNNGNHWNNSTGVWTCPVAGRYWCYAAFLIDDNQGAATLARFGFKKNGSEFFISYNHDKYGSSYGGMATAGGIFNCAANDTITCVATHGKFHAGGESSFSICLLG